MVNAFKSPNPTKPLSDAYTIHNPRYVLADKLRYHIDYAVFSTQVRLDFRKKDFESVCFGYQENITDRSSNSNLAMMTAWSLAKLNRMDELEEFIESIISIYRYPTDLLCYLLLEQRNIINTRRFYEVLMAAFNRIYGETILTGGWPATFRTLRDISIYRREYHDAHTWNNGNRCPSKSVEDIISVEISNFYHVTRSLRNFALRFSITSPDGLDDVHSAIPICGERELVNMLDEMDDGGPVLASILHVPFLTRILNFLEESSSNTRALAKKMYMPQEHKEFEICFVDSDQSRLAAFVVAFKHLRKNGILLISPDGHTGETVNTINVNDHPLRVVTGASSLAKRAHAKSVLLHTSYSEAGISLDFVSFPEINFSLDAVEFNQTWALGLQETLNRATQQPNLISGLPHALVNAYRCFR